MTEYAIEYILLTSSTLPRRFQRKVERRFLPEQEAQATFKRMRYGFYHLPGGGPSPYSIRFHEAVCRELRGTVYALLDLDTMEQTGPTMRMADDARDWTEEDTYLPPGWDKRSLPGTVYPMAWHECR